VLVLDEAVFVDGFEGSTAATLRPGD
jgi:hypothetical protein